MAVESIGVTEQAEGVNVACMEASENDTNKTEIRVIQQLDLVHAKKTAMVFATPDFAISSGNDTNALTNPLVDPFLSRIMTVGDNSLLEIICHLRSGSEFGAATITPIIVSALDAPMGLLPTKGLCGIKAQGMSDYIGYTDTGDRWTLCPPLTWWVGQYEKISFMITDANIYDIRVWATLHTGFPNDKYDMFTANKADCIGGTGGPMESVADSGCYIVAG